MLACVCAMTGRVLSRTAENTVNRRLRIVPPLLSGGELWRKSNKSFYLVLIVENGDNPRDTKTQSLCLCGWFPSFRDGPERALASAWPRHNLVGARDRLLSDRRWVCRKLTSINS